MPHNARCAGRGLAQRGCGGLTANPRGYEEFEWEEAEGFSSRARFAERRGE